MKIDQSYVDDLLNKKFVNDLIRNVERLNPIFGDMRDIDVFKEFGIKEFKDYEKCYATLGAMVRLRCSRVCRDGGGPPFCNIRKCCEKKNIQGCWECEEFETCTKLDFLKPIHEDAHLKNLKKIKKQGTDKFISGKRYW